MVKHKIQKKDKLRLETATWIIYFLQLDMLPTPRDGIRGDNAEPFIYKNELQSITQGMRRKLQILNEMATSIVSIEDEESVIPDIRYPNILVYIYNPTTWMK